MVSVETEFYTPSGFVRAGDLHEGFAVFDDARRCGSTVAKISDVVEVKPTYTIEFEDGAEIVCTGCQAWICLTKFELDFSENPREILRLCTTREIYRNPTKTYLVCPVWNVHRYREIVKVSRKNKQVVSAIEVSSRPEMRSFLISEQMVPLPNPKYEGKF